jgi:hypothetical protein
MAGYDTAGEIQNTYQGAHDEFGADPGYWIRYFTPSPAADVFNSDPTAESEGAWASGGHFVGCISAPTQSDLSSGSGQGQLDAQTFAAAMLSAYNTTGPLDLPSNNELWAFLDQEYSTSLSTGYWDAWSNYIANYNFAGLRTYPLYPALYCTPSSPWPNCSTIAAATGLDIPVTVWTPVPEPCGTLTDTPPWDPEECSAYSSSTVPTNLWQFAEQGGCGLSANVDIDVADVNFADYCFRLLSDP